MEEKKSPLLEIQNLSVSFRMYERGLKRQDLKVISDLHLTVYPGEILAIAGSSGSGKSLLASAVLGVLPANSACQENCSIKETRLRLNGKDSFAERKLRLFRSRFPTLTR